MALEYKLSYTASEIDKKLTDIDEISASLALKADIIDGKIPLEQLPDNIGGGLTEVSWEDIKDKPFYDDTVFVELPTDISNCTKINSQVISLMGIPITFIKVDESIFKSADSIIDTDIKLNFEAGDTPLIECTISENDIYDLGIGFLTMAFAGGGFFPFFIDINTVGTVTLPTSNSFGEDAVIDVAETGLYFLYVDGMAQMLSCEKNNIKQIDKKYIPSEIGTWAEMPDKPFGEENQSIEWDGTPTDEFFDVSDTMGAILYKVGESKTKEELIGATCKYNTFDPLETIEYIIASSDIKDTDSENCFVIFHNMFGIAVSVLKDGSYDFMGINFVLTKGIWFVKASNYMPIYLGAKEIKQINPKFIPNYFGEVGFYTDCDVSNATAAISVPVNEDDFGMSEFSFFKFSEPMEGSIQGYLLSVLVDGENMEISMGDENVEAPIIVSDTGSEYTLYALNIKTDNEIVNMEDFGLPIFTVAEAGLYVLDISLLGGQINYFKSPDYNMIKIDKKFIPDDITAAVSITYDEFPIEGSQNPVKSAGIHSAISALESKVTSAFCYKGTVKDYTDLPIEGNSIGDVWNIANADETNEVEAGDNAAWDGESWDILAGVIDLSNYYTKEEINTLIGNCDTVINSINTLIGGV